MPDDECPLPVAWISWMKWPFYATYERILDSSALLNQLLDIINIDPGRTFLGLGFGLFLVDKPHTSQGDQPISRPKTLFFSPLWWNSENAKVRDSISFRPLYLYFSPSSFTSPLFFVNFICFWRSALNKSAEFYYQDYDERRLRISHCPKILAVENPLGLFHLFSSSF